MSQLSYVTQVVVGWASPAARTPAPPHHDGLVITTLAKAAAALVAAGLFAWAVKQLLAPSLTRAGTGFAAWLADTAAVLRSSSLRRIRRYQRSVAGYAAEHTLGFRAENTLGFSSMSINVRDVYVPLHRETAADAGREDLYELIRRAGCAVVTGEAGAGKSMLLKHSLQEWSDRRTDRRAQIPVLIELRRLNGLEVADIDLTAQVTAFLETNRYKGAANFVPKALEDGRLSLLFDGLDEVSADRLDHVVDLLRDFARRYDGCQVVVTCRTSLYRGELNFGTVIQVAELDDATIRSLLSRWPGLDHAAQERLYRALGTNGTLKRLARNPLLLSLMALLTVEEITLPTSRADFYDTASKHLMERDELLGRGRSQFKWTKKQAVLRGLALLLQDRADGDRLSFSHAEALEYIRSVAMAIDLDVKDAEPLLKEIADRTELLLSTGGVAPRYSFRHLTFQEFLAALELRDDRDGLLTRYDRDHNAWREVVILWCGKADRDASPLIKELMSRASTDERVLALECAAAATKVDEATMTAIVEQLVPSLGAAQTEVREQVIVAFGNSAAGSGPRSALVRGRLLELARDNNADKKALPGKQISAITMRRSALRALALSGHESAADYLADLATTDAMARRSLSSMGDLAVPSLAARAGSDDADAIDDLAAIGTPQAIETLLGLLDGTGPGARRAAWRLAGVLGDSAFAAAVERSGAPATGRAALGAYGWVWQPFSEDSAMVATVARIARLIQESAVDEVPGDLSALDFRLVLALSVIMRESGNYPPSPGEAEPRIREAMGKPVPGKATFSSMRQAFGELADQPVATAEMTDLRRWVFDTFHLDDKQRLMISSLAWADQVRALRALVLNSNRQHWSRTALTPVARWGSNTRFLAWLLVGEIAASFVAIPVMFEFPGSWISLLALLGNVAIDGGIVIIVLRNARKRLNPVRQVVEESATATASASIIPDP